MLIQNGIHAGEIDGKDASLMLLRELALGMHPEILDAVTLVVLPIYNVDGHERISPFNRPNQDGPRQGMGFRTTTNGLDLNRDYLKLSSEEARSLIALVNYWRPHLHVDDHVTDGVDMDWVLTWSWAEAPQAPAPVDAWLRAHMPAVLAATAKAGHKVGPYVDLVDRNDPAKGFSSWVGQPRYSTGYFPLRNRPSILVENHSYKPYRQRVLANRDFLWALLDEMARDPAALTRAVAAAPRRPRWPRASRTRRPRRWRWTSSRATRPDRIRLPVYAGEMKTSVVSGAAAPALPPRRGDARSRSPGSTSPGWSSPSPGRAAIWCSPAGRRSRQRLRGHGLRVERLAQAGGARGRGDAGRRSEARRRLLPGADPADRQGRADGGAAADPRRRALGAGGPAGLRGGGAAPGARGAGLAALLGAALLASSRARSSSIRGCSKGWRPRCSRTPGSPPSGQAALADPKLAADSQARYQWWFRRTPYRDAAVGLLPYFRVMKAPALDTRPWQ